MRHQSVIRSATTEAIRVFAVPLCMLLICVSCKKSDRVTAASGPPPTNPDLAQPIATRPVEAQTNPAPIASGGVVQSKAMKGDAAWTTKMSQYVSGTHVKIPNDSKDFPSGLMSYSGAPHYGLQGKDYIAELECDGKISIGAGDGSSGVVGAGSDFTPLRIKFSGGEWLDISRCSFSKDKLLVVTVDSGKSYKVGFGFNMQGSVEDYP